MLPFTPARGRFITANLLPTDELTPDQLTTLVTPEETVTVVDPGHPLFGRTLPCVGISNSSYRGRCCIVWIGPTKPTQDILDVYLLSTLADAYACLDKKI